MAKRRKFDEAYDNNAEILLADLEYFDDGAERDTELKDDVIRLHNARLDERTRRKNSAIERG